MAKFEVEINEVFIPEVGQGFSPARVAFKIVKDGKHEKNDNAQILFDISEINEMNENQMMVFVKNKINKEMEILITRNENIGSLKKMEGMKLEIKKSI